MIINSQKTLIDHNTMYILYTIMSNPMCSTKDITKITRIPQTIVYRLVKKLVEQNMIKKDNSKIPVGKKSHKYRTNIDKLQLTITKNDFKLATYKT